MRSSNNPYQPRILYFMASFINDVAHENKLQSSVIDQEGAGFDFSGRAPDALLHDLDEAIMALDFPRTTALRDRLLLATARLLAGWLKMPGGRDCFARFEKDWIYH